MSNQQKNIGLLIGFLISGFIAYHFAIKKTVAAKSKHGQLLVEKNLVDNAGSKIEYLNKKNGNLNTFLVSNNLSVENSFQQMLLEKINVFSKEKNIQIVAFDKPHKIEGTQTVVETYSFKLKGGFIDLLKLINYIEQQRLGELISIDFEKKKNYKTRHNYLTLNIFLQKIKNN
jgi:hypothetical protein